MKSEYHAIYYRENRERIAAYNADYYRRNQKRLSEYHATRYLNNRDEMLAAERSRRFRVRISQCDNAAKFAWGQLTEEQKTIIRDGYDRHIANCNKYGVKATPVEWLTDAIKEMRRIRDAANNSEGCR